MIDIFLIGMGVGLAIAAPVGPIGILCIRRSIAEGRAAGMATGLGAAMADATYGTLVAIGVTSLGLLTRYAAQMQFLGGLIILWLGVLTLRGVWKNGSAAPSSPLVVRRSVWRGFTSSYLLTLSNPVTILAFTGMISGLGRAASGGVGTAYILVGGVFAGSALWWLILVHLALWLRGGLAVNALRWLDLSSGLILIIWGGALALSAAKTVISTSIG